MTLLLLGCRLVEDLDAGACPPWSGLVDEGLGWVYEDFASGATTIVSLTDLSADGATVHAGTWQETYACDDDGAWLVERRATDGTWSGRWSFEPPFLAVPRHLEPGDAWTMEQAWRYVDTDGRDEVASASVQVEATRLAETWVPAGSWETIELSLRRDDGSTDRQFWAREVGLVLSDHTQLVQYGGD